MESSRRKKRLRAHVDGVAARPLKNNHRPRCLKCGDGVSSSVGSCAFLHTRPSRPASVGATCFCRDQKVNPSFSGRPQTRWADCCVGTDMRSPSSELSTREISKRPVSSTTRRRGKNKIKTRSDLVGSGRRAQPDHKIESQVKEGDLASPAEDCDEVACGFVVGKTAGCDGRFGLMDTARRRGSPGDGTTWAPIWPAPLLPMMLQRHSTKAKQWNLGRWTPHPKLESGSLVSMRTSNGGREVAARIGRDQKRTKFCW